jgi:hypothetical protein
MMRDAFTFHKQKKIFFHSVFCYCLRKVRADVAFLLQPINKWYTRPRNWKENESHAVAEKTKRRNRKNASLDFN